jgi:hypothetical protein
MPCPYDIINALFDMAFGLLSMLRPSRRSQSHIQDSIPSSAERSRARIEGSGSCAAPAPVQTRDSPPSMGGARGGRAPVWLRHARFVRQARGGLVAGRDASSRAPTGWATRWARSSTAQAISWGSSGPAISLNSLRGKRLVLGRFHAACWRANAWRVSRGALSSRPCAR